MAQVIVRGIDEKVLARLKSRALRRQRSLEAELRLILQEAARDDLEDAKAQVREIRERLRGRSFSDSTSMIREDRER
jgi:antitoxin FitA